MAKKISVIGRGTAGCIAASIAKSVKEVHNHHTVEIDWFYDPQKSPVSVGEGTTPIFLSVLRSLGDYSTNLDDYDARPKIGIEYENWGASNYIHPFRAGWYGIHFDATKFQDVAFRKLTEDRLISTHTKNVCASELDSDVVIDCTGTPKSFDGYVRPRFIPVNAVYVTQCQWHGEPKWLHTKTIARPWGWVFVIPLQTRCSVGYLYNRDISSLDQVKDDVQEVFAELNVKPTDRTNAFHFENYIRENLIDKNTLYCGNSGFFLEPMEATTLDSVFRVADHTEAMLFDPQFSEIQSNNKLHMFFQEIEYFIMMHYAAGSKWDNTFWDFARARGEAALSEASKHPIFCKLFDYQTDHVMPYIRYFLSNSVRVNRLGLGI